MICKILAFRRGLVWSYRKYNFPYILVRHKKYQAATGVLKDLAPARYFFIDAAKYIFSHTIEPIGLLLRL